MFDYGIFGSPGSGLQDKAPHVDAEVIMAATLFGSVETCTYKYLSHPSIRTSGII